MDAEGEVELGRGEIDSNENTGLSVRFALLREMTYPGLAYIFEKMGSPERALEYYEKVVAIADEHMLTEEALVARYRLGQIYRGIGRYEASLEALQQASSAADTRVGATKMVDIQEEIGITQMHRGAWNEAMDAFEKALLLCKH